MRSSLYWESEKVGRIFHVWLLATLSLQLSLMQLPMTHHVLCYMWLASVASSVSALRSRRLPVHCARMSKAGFATGCCKCIAVASVVLCRIKHQLESMTIFVIAVYYIRACFEAWRL